MKDRDFPGARWWKFDFHTHTPASDDFANKNGVTPESWLKKFMDEGIDCVAITDHNGGGWIDRLKTELEELKQNKPPWYRPLYLFPGVEISAGDAHILAIFGCEKTESDIDALLGAVGYPSSARGTTNAITKASITEVIDEIADQDGIPIPAHASDPKGIFKLPSQTLQKVLGNERIYAMEFLKNTPDKPQLYNDRKLNWTEVQGSDTHFSGHDAFGRFTWVKMDTPSIDGLKLALIDGTGSANRNMEENPNQLPDYFIEKLVIDQAKYVGRSKPLKCQFSPFLNTIIGGRGSGKSTLMEFMRLVLRRDKDIPHMLEQEIQRFFEVEGNGPLIRESRISLSYRKRGILYRLKWAHMADECISIEVLDNGNWISCEGEIKSLFPVRIYSQKQIYEVAKKPIALLDIVDDAPDVDAQAINLERRNLVNRYKQFEIKQQELMDNISQENRLRGELGDLTRQIAEIEKSGHETILHDYGRRQRQLSEFTSVESKWTEMADQITNVRDGIGPAQFNEHHFAEHTEILSYLSKTNEKWRVIRGKLDVLVSEARSVLNDWETEKNTAIWMQELMNDVELYESLSTELNQAGIDPSRYRLLLAQQKTLQKELGRISEYRSRYDELETEKEGVYRLIKQNRGALSEKRQRFLTKVLRNNRDVRIKVIPFGEQWEDIEKKIRKILQCQAPFDRDFAALKDNYLSDGDNRISKLKKTVQAIRNGEKSAEHATFAKHLKLLPSESVNNLVLWFPKDGLRITFGRYDQQIEEGSPGQKSAALLAFILSYGEEPLLLDQPEDDLDNELIYDLIVKQLRKTKSKRQIIVITHNANIVVNGDAEMVLPLHVICHETRVRADASIQAKEVRDAVCDILEGGQRAFEQRYRRINLGK